jgi:hypothetical protein
MTVETKTVSMALLRLRLMKNQQRLRKLVEAKTLIECEHCKNVFTYDAFYKEYYTDDHYAERCPCCGYYF